MDVLMPRNPGAAATLYSSSGGADRAGATSGPLLA
jgi:hypothetical protein